MASVTRTKGRWFQRFVIRLFTFLMALLTYWLLGFLLDDIASLKGPDYETIEKEHVDSTLYDKKKSLSNELATISREISNQEEKQKNIKDGSDRLEQTLSQLNDLQKSEMDKGGIVNEEQKKNYADSLNLFLENQKQYQQLSQDISAQLEKRQAINIEKWQVDEEIEKERAPALKEYNDLLEKHHLKVAFYQLALLIPLLLLSIFLYAKMRKSIYLPLIQAFTAATAFKVASVIGDYFPSRYFKYIALLALLSAVAFLLVRLIRAVAYPKKQSLLQQYREGYERFLCPSCEYPIRTGPRRFLYWTRRTVNKVIPSFEKEQSEEVYVCPNCGQSLFEECVSCNKIRHSLLPNCSHCGREKLNDYSSA